MFFNKTKHFTFSKQNFNRIQGDIINKFMKSEAPLQSDYSEISYFSREYKKAEGGVSPSAFFKRI